MADSAPVGRVRNYPFKNQPRLPTILLGMDSVLVRGPATSSKPFVLTMDTSVRQGRRSVRFGVSVLAAVVAGFLCGFMPRVLAFADSQGLGVGTLFVLGAVFVVLIGAVAVLEACIIES